MGKNKPIIGIVGGMGSGKTTVAGLFSGLGCAVISADELNHELLRKKDVIDQIVAIWGPGVVGESGQIDHKVLSDKVFANKEELDKLMSLLHPLIQRRQDELIEKYRSDGKIAAIILDVPLLYEVGWQEYCDAVVFVACDEEKRYAQLAKRGHWDRAKIKKIENFQIALDKKAQMSEYIVENKSSIPDLAKQVAKLLILVLEKE
jgi:dephospho-CoA kinase